LRKFAPTPHASPLPPLSPPLQTPFFVAELSPNKARKEKNISQQDIAAFLHIKQNTYSQYENGKRQLPIEILISLARFYNVSTDFILGLTDNEDPYP
jgi:DNA-binding XRE family transcriptional regulator